MKDETPVQKAVRLYTTGRMSEREFLKRLDRLVAAEIEAAREACVVVERSRERRLSTDPGARVAPS